MSSISSAPLLDLLTEETQNGTTTTETDDAVIRSYENHEDSGESCWFFKIVKSYVSMKCIVVHGALQMLGFSPRFLMMASLLYIMFRPRRSTRYYYRPFLHTQSSFKTSIKLYFITIYKLRLHEMIYRLLDSGQGLVLGLIKSYNLTCNSTINDYQRTAFQTSKNL